MIRVPNIFFITGLPRTRSAWLANLFTYGPAFCFHEALLEHKYACEIVHSFQRVSDYQFVGNSDSMLLKVATEIKVLFPFARWVHVRRAPEDCKIAYDRWKANTRLPDVSIQTVNETHAKELALIDLIPAMQYKSVAFDSLNAETTVREVWEFVTEGSVPFNTERWKLLDKLYVSTIPEKAYARFLA